MKILKVIVDELPETCEDCQFFYENEDGYIGCELEIGLKYLNRPSDCPLQTERTCGNCLFIERSTHAGYLNNMEFLCGHGLSADIQETDFCSKWEAKE